MLDIQPTVNQWLADSQEVALATVVQTWGSAPRRAGSKMAVTRNLDMIGSVSGGCIEGSVIEEMMGTLDTGQGELLAFGISDDTAWDVGLSCGGKIKVFVEPLNLDWWTAISQLVNADEKAVTVTVLDGEHRGQKMVFDGAGNTRYGTHFPAGLLSEIIDIHTHQKSDLLQYESQQIMIDVHQPRPHLIIIGGVHIAIPLQSYARQLGFRVSIIDPRKAFATDARFPDVDAILHDYPDKSLPRLGLTPNTYIAVLTHDPKIDDRALMTALPSPVPYIGVLSSAKSHHARIERLTEAGVSPELQARIQTPIGIDINAQTPEEIALCIMAQIVAVRNSL